MTATVAPPVTIALSPREVEIITTALMIRKADMLGMVRLCKVTGAGTDRIDYERQIDELDALRAKVSPEITNAEDTP